MNIALIGYGKMGHIIEQTALSRGHKIVCTIDLENHNDIATAAFRSADVAIEFSAPQSAWANIQASLAENVPVVSGTTGWQVEQCQQMFAKQPMKWKPVLWSPNYSIGVNILFALNKRLAELMKPYSQYTPQIEEIHHVHKLDAPSGTAKHLATDAESIIGKPINVNSIREGEVPGTHIVTYDSPVDSITLTHEAKSREGFALGAIIAAEWLVKQPSGFYTMQNLLQF